MPTLKPLAAKLKSELEQSDKNKVSQEVSGSEFVMPETPDNRIVCLEWILP